MDNNPLKQYFRRPAIHLSLPSKGVGYPEGALDMPDNNELPVYPMTAIDEITVRTPDALFNGSAITDLIRSCIPNIKDPWAVPNVDLDAILVAIKAASSQSGNIDIDSICPNCESSSSYQVPLASLLSSLGNPDFDSELEISDLKFKFKPIPFKDVNEASKDQFDFQRTTMQIDDIENDDERNKIVTEALHKITNITMQLLSKSIASIETPLTKVDDSQFILDFLLNCDKNTYTAVRDHSAKLREESEVKPMKISCPSCNHEYEQPITLNPSDFFG